MTDIQRMDFYGDQMSTCQDDQTGKVYCLPREIAEDCLNVDWPNQWKKLQGPFYQPYTHRCDITTKGQAYETILLDVDILPTWLLSISPQKVKLAVREKLLRFQHECASALRDYWYKGAAINPRQSPAEAMYQGIKGYVDSEITVVKQEVLEVKQIAIRAETNGLRVERKFQEDQKYRLTAAQRYVKNETTADMRRILVSFANNKCLRCGYEFHATDHKNPRYPEIDEVMPVCQGGNRTWDNVQILCKGCNYLREKARRLGVPIHLSWDFRDRHHTFKAACARHATEISERRQGRNDRRTLPLFDDSCIRNRDEY